MDGLMAIGRCLEGKAMNRRTFVSMWLAVPLVKPAASKVSWLWVPGHPELLPAAAKVADFSEICTCCNDPWQCDTCKLVKHNQAERLEAYNLLATNDLPGDGWI